MWLPRGPDGVRGALWRSLSVFRVVAAAYALGAVGRTLGQSAHLAPGIVWFGVIVTWSAFMSILAPAFDGRRPRLLKGLVVADVAVCAGIVLTTGAVSPRGAHDVLPAMWSASGVFSAALAGGTAAGFGGGLFLAVASFFEQGAVTDASTRPAVLFAMSGTIVGYLSRTAIRAEAALADVLEARAADAERERLARGVHDGVLQVLSLIAREAARGMATADVARLAADQESALRDLFRTPGASQAPAAGRGPGPRHKPGSAGPGPPESDLVALLMDMTRSAAPVPVPVAGPAASARPATRASTAALAASAVTVTVSTPGVPVPLRTDHAAEVVAAVRVALDNVAAHAGPGASAWLLLEDDGDAVTVRDDGIGIAHGRVEQAAAEGRLGLAVSVFGRIRDLGGDVIVTGRPGRGTEVELRVPRLRHGR